VAPLATRASTERSGSSTAYVASSGRSGTGPPDESATTHRPPALRSRRRHAGRKPCATCWAGIDGPWRDDHRVGDQAGQTGSDRLSACRAKALAGEHVDQHTHHPGHRHIGDESDEVDDPVDAKAVQWRGEEEVREHETDHGGDCRGDDPAERGDTGDRDESKEQRAGQAHGGMQRGQREQDDARGHERKGECRLATSRRQWDTGQPSRWAALGSQLGRVPRRNTWTSTVPA